MNNIPLCISMLALSISLFRATDWALHKSEHSGLGLVTFLLTMFVYMATGVEVIYLLLNHIRFT